MPAIDAWVTLDGDDTVFVRGQYQGGAEVVVTPVTGGASAYTHVQSTPAAEWTVNHALGFYPGGVTVIDSAGTTVEGDIAYIDPSTLTLTFAAAFAGTAYLS